MLNPEDDGPSQQQALPMAPHQVLIPDIDTGFETQLRGLLEQSGQGGLLAGRINFIGLHKIKDKFGASWDHLAKRADLIARKIIERHLVPGDIYTALQNIAYVIVFARLPQEQAQIKCMMIGEEIAKALLGDQGAELLEVKTVVKRVDGSFDLKAISLTEQLMTSLSHPYGVHVAAEKSASKAAKSSKPSHDILAGVKFAYRPMWDQARNVISTYLCVAQVPTSDIGGAMGDADLVMGHDTDEMAQLDDAVRLRVLDDLEEMMRDNRRLLLTLPVHFETLGSVARRRHYLDGLKQRLTAESGKLLVIELTSVPIGVPQSRLVDLIVPLRQFCRGVMLRMPLETPDFTQVKGSGAAAIGCNVTSHPGPEVMLMQQMNRFNRTAEKAEVPTYMHGAQSLSQVTAAVGAGFAYIDGDAVAKLIDHPRRVADFRLTDLYSPFIKA